MKNEAPGPDKQRSAFRLPVGAGDPVHLLFSVDGTKVDPEVDELGAGGARFFTADHYHRFYIDQVLGPTVLVLPDFGKPVVHPVVRWMSYPSIGVEFDGISHKDRELVFRFMFRAERNIVQIKRSKSVDDRFK